MSGDVQTAVISLIDDTFMDKTTSFMELRLQMLRIGQSADIIATQTHESLSSTVPPTPATQPQNRVITEAEILGTQTPKGPTPRQSPPISAEQQLATQSAKYLPSAQPYIAPPPSQKRVITEAEMLGAQTPKRPTPWNG